MKKRPFSTLIFLLVFIIIFFVGCSQKQENENKIKPNSAQTYTEYFNESTLNLPNDLFYAYDFRITKTSSFLLVGQAHDRSGFLWSSKDGKSWERMLELPDTFSKSVVLEAVFIDDSHLFISAAYDALQSSNNNAGIRYYLVSTDGTFEQKTLNSEDDSLSEFQISGTTVYGLNQNGQIVAYDYMTGKKVLTFNKTSMFANYFCLIDEQILAIGPSQVETYDIFTGNTIDMDENFKQQLIEVSDKNNLSFLCKLYYCSENCTLYYITCNGLYTYNFTTKTFQTALNGQHHIFGNSEIKVTTLTPYTNKLYMTCYISDTKNSLFVYTPEPEGKTFISDRITLDLYSLHQNTEVINIVNLFNSSQKDIFVNYTYDIQGSDSSTEQDALNSLSLQLLSGNGPDILLLDDIRHQNFIDKGVLSDISDIAQDYPIADNIASSYKRNNKTYGIPLYFKLIGIHANKNIIKNIGSIEKLTSSLENVKKAHPDKLILEKFEQSSYADALYHAYSKDLYKNGKLNKNKLESFYLQLQKINNIADYGYTVNISEPAERNLCDYSFLMVNSIESSEELLQINEVQTAIGGILSPFDYALISSYKNSTDFDFAFFKQGENAICIPNTVISINTQGKNVDAARNFIRFCLSTNFYLEGGYSFLGFPVNLEIIKQEFKHTKSSVSLNDSNDTENTIRIKNLSIKERNKFYHLLDTMTPSTATDSTIKHIIFDEAEKYINKSQSLEQSVTTVVEKVNLYLAE